MFQWVFAGLGHNIPSQIVSGAIALQGSGNGGDGSCASAALNFVESQLDTSIPRWSGSASEVYQNMCLRDLIVYHSVSSGLQDMVAPKCMIWCILQMEIIDSPYAYTDFNVFSPTVCPQFIF